MTFPKDENGRYSIPAQPHEPRVEMDCSCGYGLNAPERVWDYVSGQHAAAHQKGADGLPARASWDIRHLDAADGTRPSSPQPEADDGAGPGRGTAGGRPPAMTSGQPGAGLNPGPRRRRDDPRGVQPAQGRSRR
jgi:hypothetical protein